MNKTSKSPFSESFSINSFEESSLISSAGNTNIKFLVENTGEQYVDTTLEICVQSRIDSDHESRISLSKITTEGCDLLISKIKDIKKFLKKNN